jgi:hypothetical protein
VILVESFAGRGSRIPRGGDPHPTKTKPKPRKNLPMKGKTKKPSSAPSRWSGRSKARFRKDLTKSLHELPLAR